MSLADAIIGGAGIGLKIRDQREQQRQFDMNESYRRDVMSENKRQFGLEHQLRRDEFGLTRDKFEDFKQRDDRNHLEDKRQFDLGYGLDKRRVSVAEGELGLRRNADRRDQETHDQGKIDRAALGQVALWGAAIANGTPLDLSALSTSLFQDDDTNREFGARHTGDPNYMNAASDKSKKPVGVADADGNVVPAYNFEDGPRPMTDDRKPGANGPVTRIPGALITGESMGKILQSPAAQLELAKLLMLRGLISEEAAADPVRHQEEIVDAATKAAASASQPQQPATPPSEGERLAALEQRMLGTGTAALNTPIPQSVAGAGQYLAALARPAAEPPPAPGQWQQPPPTPQESGGLGGGRSAYRDLYRMGQLGLNPDQVTAYQATGVSNPALAGDLLEFGLGGKGQLTGKGRTQARQRLIDQYFEKGDSKDFKAKGMRQMAPQLVDLLDNMTQGAISAETETGHAMMSQLSTLARRAQHKDDYAALLRSNPHLMAGLAYAEVNPDTVGKENFESIVESLANEQNSTELSAADFAKLAKRARDYLMAD